MCTSPDGSGGSCFRSEARLCRVDDSLIKVSIQMSKKLRSTGCALVVIGTFASTVAADETFFQEDNPDAAVSVECHGQLRHGVFAIGGESTGTTITFHRITWELQLPDETAREFAQQNHGKPVVVTGTLRRIVTTERKVRWILDVTRIRERDGLEGGRDGATMTVRGILRAALSQNGNIPEFSVSTSSLNWKLDLDGNRKIQEVAVSLIGKSVLVNGAVPQPPERTKASGEKQQPTVTPTVRVSNIRAANRISVAPRTVE